MDTMSILLFLEKQLYIFNRHNSKLYTKFIYFYVMIHFLQNICLKESLTTKKLHAVKLFIIMPISRKNSAQHGCQHCFFFHFISGLRAIQPVAPNVSKR